MTEKEKDKKALEDYAEYLCRRCRGWFLFEEFDIENQQCKKCREKRKARLIQKGDVKVNPDSTFWGGLSV